MKKGIMVGVFQVLTGVSAALVAKNGSALVKAKKNDEISPLKVFNLMVGCAAVGLNVVHLLRANKRQKQLGE